MNKYRPVLHVAAWEFRRYVKPKQQVIGFIISVITIVGFVWLGRRGQEPSSVELAVVGAQNLATLEAQAGRFTFEPYDAARLPDLLEEVEQRDRTAVLVIETSGTGSLHTRQAPGWQAALERELGVAAQLARLDRSGITAQQIAEISAPFQLEVAESAPRAGRSERIAAFAAVTLAIVGLFSGIGYIFSSVTGEKQNRLSEQVISTIPPQSWIDGKIIGLAAVSMVAILNFVAAIGVSFLLGRAGWGITFELPTTIANPGLLLAALLFVGLGFLFWFAFLTAVAAIVDDPHTSTRNQLLFVPVLAFVPAFIAVGDPSATWVRAMAVLPPTSAGLMPVRLLMTDVRIMESLLALLLLVAAIWLVRRAAGKVFRLGMLMYGKEPTWAEVRRWLREA